MYLDHHTHLNEAPRTESGIMRIFSIDASITEDIERIPEIKASGHACTIGLHPMSFNAMTFSNASQIIYHHRDAIIGIGECGLDTRIEISRTKQIELFSAQARLAMEMQLPLIIHSVRSHDDILDLHQKLKPSNPWIIHGFNRKEAIAIKLLEQGIFLSIGKELLDIRHPLSIYFSNIAEYPFFLETDGKDIAIQTLYQQASELLGMSIEEISTIIAEHAQRVYGTIRSHSPTLE